MAIKIYPKYLSNSTQNKPYPGKFIPVDHIPARKMIDRALQEDWENFPELKYSILAGYDVGLIIEWKRKAVADARKEVIRKIEIWTKDSLQNGNVEEFDCLKELQDVLATLREEES